MDASAFLELQEAWTLHTNEQGRAFYSEINMKAYNMEFPDEGYGGPFNAHTEEEAVHMEDEALMMDRPFLDYINEILMDEAMEDRTFEQHNFISYQAIINGFYDIIGEGSDANIQSAYNSDHVSLYSSIQEASEPIQGVYNSDYIRQHTVIGWNSAPSGYVSLSGITGEHSTHARFSSSSDEISFDNHISEHSALTQSSSTSGKLCAYSRKLDGNIDILWDVDAIHNEYSQNNPVLRSTLSMPLSTDHSNSYHGHVSLVKNMDHNVEAEYENVHVDKDQTASHESYAKDNWCDRSTEGKLHKGLADDKQDNRHVDDKRHNSHVDDMPRNGRVDPSGKKGATAGGLLAKQKSKTNRKVDMDVGLDLKEFLVRCAQAVAFGDRKRAADMLQELQKNGTSPNGSAMQRVIYYFCEALKARMHGKGNPLYSETLTENRPSIAKLLKAYKSSHIFIPYFKIAHYFANQSILKAAKGATRLHIIDYGILYGLQWPCLINALADRKEGPPKLIITGIEFPQPGPNPAERLIDTGQRLTEYAKMYNVPFEFHAISASSWEDVNHESLNNVNGSEVLVVNCMNRLRHVADDCVIASSSSTSSPRQKLIYAIHNLNPDIFVVAVMNAACNSPFFVARFREALNFYCNLFDMHEATWDDSSERMMIERNCIYKEILNVIASEGLERVQRPECYKQWQAYFQLAGFEHVPIVPTVLSRSMSHVKSHYHKDFYVDHDSNCWMLLGWKGRTAEAVSAWKRRRTDN